MIGLLSLRNWLQVVYIYMTAWASVFTYNCKPAKALSVNFRNWIREEIHVRVWLKRVVALWLGYTVSWLQDNEFEFCWRTVCIPCCSTQLTWQNWILLVNQRAGLVSRCIVFNIPKNYIIGILARWFHEQAVQLIRLTELLIVVCLLGFVCVYGIWSMCVSTVTIVTKLNHA